MALKFVVEIPSQASRFVLDKEPESTVLNYGGFSATLVSTLETKVIVTGLTGDALDAGRLVIRYCKDYDSSTSLDDFFRQAKCFARQYCESIGIMVGDEPAEEERCATIGILTRGD
ncbi:TPA: hypothetical protein N3I44_005442 [Klebsiella quasipneumoniae]|uniref:hypothetical protein n=1 Tax=Klebsiella quasipneumoniae TaxID=1463165 RepID=UPI001ABC6F7E|nr:hypothetical protein [Klebsiella quasipneumoniae]MBO3690016.1 hypothetical protein [Klebsiella quasipneumoniae subsp. similipneumoniae]HBW1630600.1 hypothetical protein [Klebsiella quasipneumoniae subsp. similipneumoniae]HBW1664197.1 hypothetical protein [Klebsiella quasipneumoniae subsp. similipneumoniae]HBW1678246.1 hypothetical protein [Klebsiella quasipneumoniae subsp. similipneumoniae]HCM3836449.1 hypothetical protein [Klebsiella quasipneumoniae]